MLDKLQNLDDKYEELGRMLADPEVLANPEELRKTAKARADLEDVVMAWREYRKAGGREGDAGRRSGRRHGADGEGRDQDAERPGGSAGARD